MKQSKRFAAGLLGIVLMLGCSAQAKIVDSRPDTEKIQIVGQIETPEPADEAPTFDEASASGEALPTPEPVAETAAPTEAPTPEPTEAPTEAPTPEPTEVPAPEATEKPSSESVAARDYHRAQADQLCDTARSLLDASYHRGGTKPETGFDPGGFVYYCLNEVGVKVRHKTSKGYSENENWQRVDEMDDLQPGDLCFFMTPGNESVNCVGIYVGDDRMIYPSSGEGKVITSKITSQYWKEAFVFARRVF